MHPEELGGAGYLVPLAGLLACLAGVAVAEAFGIALTTMARVGIPGVFVLVILGWAAYTIDRYRSVGEREERIRTYLRNEEYLDDDE